MLPLARLLGGGRYGYELGQRLGRYPHVVRPDPAQTSLVWIHASSVGEVRAAVILIEALLATDQHLRIVLSSTTEQGREMALDQLGSGIPCILAPLDVRPAVSRALRLLHPALYIGLETELWPMFLSSLDQAGVPRLLLNGRLSERSFARYLRIRSFMRPLVAGFHALAVITAADGKRFAGLGGAATKIQVCGNLKYDMPAEHAATKRQQLRTRLGIGPQQALFLCGSTHAGEEALLLQVFQELAAEFDLIWIVAPRHLERLNAVECLFRQVGLAYDRYSALPRQPRGSSVVLVDTMGDLADLYAAADHIFCGGSLVNRGGHNIMEAARWGRPVCFGPHMHDFDDAAKLLLENGGGFQIDDASALAALLRSHHASPQKYRLACMRAAETAASQRGAVARQVALVRQHLEHGQG